MGFEQLDPDLKYKKVKASNPFTDMANDDDDWNVKNYLSNWNTIRLVRETGHYDQKTLKMVFAQNHINALVIELIFFISNILELISCIVGLICWAIELIFQVWNLYFGCWT